ncbi:HRDC domain-containing protein [Clostridium sp. OS1-26]|uniref:HRDC domain-containing protein n=1 Tax=Clostridium sp. OS1-26 TaxID=3070681 RepID=UPI0027E17215|nr:HRDC domain-containing protein [Clostridium sp. OS1-26]WML34334.1 HRDC domain-containing protein [Clostridium sp. OS1-26]
MEKRADESTNSVYIEENNLYKELKRYRLERSKADGIKPYFIYTNVQLEEIANKKQKTIDELKAIKGFGDVKCEKHGEDVIGIVRRNI